MIILCTSPPHGNVHCRNVHCKSTAATYTAAVDLHPLEGLPLQFVRAVEANEMARRNSSLCSICSFRSVPKFYLHSNVQPFSMYSCSTEKICHQKFSFRQSHLTTVVRKWSGEKLLGMHVDKFKRSLENVLTTLFKLL